MPEIRIVVVGAKFEGNVGAIARSMANFDLKELYLVNPCEIGDDAYRRSKHGSQILDEAKVVSSFEEAVKDCFLVVGTSGVTTRGDRNYTRVPVPVREFAEHCRGYPEKIAVVFGREDIGLLQEELNLCDVLITIPTGEEYPILNLSHAANIVMYEFFQAENVPRRPEPADREERERMFGFFADLMESIEYPPTRREMTQVMFRRMMGRAIPTKYEYNTIMGVFGDASKIIRYGKPWEKRRSGSPDREEHHHLGVLPVVPADDVGHHAGHLGHLVVYGSGLGLAQVGADRDHYAAGGIVPGRGYGLLDGLDRVHLGHVGERVHLVEERAEERPREEVRYALHGEYDGVGYHPERAVHPGVGAHPDDAVLVQDVHAVGGLGDLPEGPLGQLATGGLEGQRYPDHGYRLAAAIPGASEDHRDHAGTGASAEYGEHHDRLVSLEGLPYGADVLERYGGGQLRIPVASLHPGRDQGYGAAVVGIDEDHGRFQDVLGLGEHPAAGASARDDQDILPGLLYVFLLGHGAPCRN